MCFNLIALSFIVITLAFSEKSTGYDITVLCVSICDILCGTYLVTVISANTHYQGIFYTQEQHWRGTFFCHLAANIFSMFTMITPSMLYFGTYSRYLVIKYPFEKKYKNSKRVWIAWSVILSVGLCVTLLLWLSYRFVENTSILETPLCTLVGSTLGSITKKVQTGLILPLCTSICVATVCTNIFLFLEVRASSSRSLGNKSLSDRDKSIIIQISIISVSNILCWIPSSVVYLLTLVLSQYPMSMLTWTIIAVVPINSIVNPSLFLGMKLKHAVKSHSGDKNKDT